MNFREEIPKVVLTWVQSWVYLEAEDSVLKTVPSNEGKSMAAKAIQTKCLSTKSLHASASGLQDIFCWAGAERKVRLFLVIPEASDAPVCFCPCSPDVWNVIEESLQQGKERGKSQ